MAAAIPAQVHYANDEQYHVLRLVSIYAEALHAVHVEPSSDLSLRNSDGNLHLTGLNTICRYIAEQGNRKQQLLGSEASHRAQVPSALCSDS